MTLNKRQIAKIRTIRDIEIARASLSNDLLKSEHRFQHNIERVRMNSTIRNIFTLAGLGIINSGFRLGKGLYRGIQWFSKKSKKKPKQ